MALVKSVLVEALLGFLKPDNYNGMTAEQKAIVDPALATKANLLATAIDNYIRSGEVLSTVQVSPDTHSGVGNGTVT